MNSLSKKQKLVIIFIAISIISIICYYIYSKEEVIEVTEEISITETKEEEKKKEESIIMVHIAGAVNKEGIVQLEEGQRIYEAIEKAEGLKENADLKDINLAYVLEDGAKVYIPTIGENVEIKMEKQEKSNKNTSVNKKVNINTANQSELETLTGIGPSTASKIIEYRKQNGKFSKIEEIKEVSGIGEMKFEKIKDEIEI